MINDFGTALTVRRWWSRASDLTRPDRSNNNDECLLTQRIIILCYPSAVEHYHPWSHQIIRRNSQRMISSSIDPPSSAPSVFAAFWWRKLQCRHLWRIDCDDLFQNGIDLSSTKNHARLTRSTDLWQLDKHRKCEPLTIQDRHWLLSQLPWSQFPL